MHGFFDRVTASVRKFMYGRYGADQFNLFLVILCPIVTLLSYLIPVQIVQTILMLLSYVLLIFAVLRMFSRNYDARSRENEWFLEKTGPIVRFFHHLNRRFTDRNYKYFRCPGCGQELRAPRGKGKHRKIRVTCQKCGTVFSQKT